MVWIFGIMFRPYPQSFFSSGLTVSLCGLISLNLLGCAPSKTAQCQKLITETQNLAKAAQENRQNVDPQKILAFAQTFEDTAKKIQGMSFNDPQLQTYQQALAAIYQSNAEATRNIVSAIQTKDITTAKMAQAQVKETGQKEQIVINQMNQYCQAD